MSFEYDEYRKRIEDFFQSDLDKAEKKMMKKILFVINKQSDIEKTIKIASLFCEKTNTHIKFINGAHYFSNKFENETQFYSLQEITKAIEESPINNGEVSIVREGNFFEGIMDIIQASKISLIVFQIPSENDIQNDDIRQILHETTNKLTNFALTLSKIPLLFLKTDAFNLEQGFSKVTMVITDWINKNSFTTIIHLSNTLKAKVTIVPFISSHVYEKSEISPMIDNISNEIQKFNVEAKDWMRKHGYSLDITSVETSTSFEEFTKKINNLDPELVVLFVPRKEKLVEVFKQFIKSTKSNVLIAPDIE